MAAGRLFRIIVILMIFAGTSSYSQQNYLSRKITVNCRNCTLETALKEVGNAGQFRFSYDATMISPDARVDLLASNEQVGSVLKKMLGKDVSLHEMGNHVILLKNKTQQGKPEEWEIRGTIRDHEGKPLKDATIYDISKKRSAISASDGKFLLIVPAIKSSMGLNISKRGFLDTVIFIRKTSSASLDIKLRSAPVISHLTPAPAEMTRNISDSSRLVRWIIPKETMINSQNLEDRTLRTFQASIIPYIGTNWRITGSVTNRFSLNLLAGYTGGLKGVEIGGLLNITARNIEGVQVGGLANVVGGTGKAWQIGGLANYDMGKFNGVQIGGLFNYTPDTISGVQIAGLVNCVTGTVKGVQIAGLVNTVTENCDAIQIAGLVNYAAQDSRRLQIAGILNYTSALKGTQIGVINIAKEHVRGIPIGLFSWVGDGYHLVEISGNEIFYGNVAYKSGTRQLYSFFQFGMGSDYKMQGSYGLGTMFTLSKKFSLNIDASAGFVYHPVDTVYHGLLLKGYPAIEYRPAKHFAVFAGPSWNFFLFHKGDPSATPRGLSTYDFYFRSTENASIQMWVGGIVGIRL